MGFHNAKTYFLVVCWLIVQGNGFHMFRDPFSNLDAHVLANILNLLDGIAISNLAYASRAIRERLRQDIPGLRIHQELLAHTLKRKRDEELLDELYRRKKTFRATLEPKNIPSFTKEEVLLEIAGVLKKGPQRPHVTLNYIPRKSKLIRMTRRMDVYLIIDYYRNNSLPSKGPIIIPRQIHRVSLRHFDATIIQRVVLHDNIHYLDFTGNQLERIVKKLKWPRHLKELHLINNNLGPHLANITLPDELEHLDVSASGLTALPPLPESLRVLKMTDNKVSLGLGYLRFCFNMKVLDLSRNSLGDRAFNLSFPDSIEVLNISRNELSDLRFVHWPENLRELFLHQNELGRDSLYLDSLRYLKVLDVSENLFGEEANAETFQIPDSVELLHLSHNHIADPNNIKLPISLQELRLDFNELEWRDGHLIAKPHITAWDSGTVPF